MQEIMQYLKKNGQRFDSDHSPPAKQLSCVTSRMIQDTGHDDFA